jgi:hypothetical protein
MRGMRRGMRGRVRRRGEKVSTVINNHLGLTSVLGLFYTILLAILALRCL